MQLATAYASAFSTGCPVAVLRASLGLPRAICASAQAGASGAPAAVRTDALRTRFLAVASGPRRFFGRTTDLRAAAQRREPHAAETSALLNTELYVACVNVQEGRNNDLLDELAIAALSPSPAVCEVKSEAGVAGTAPRAFVLRVFYDHVYDRALYVCGGPRKELLEMVVALSRAALEKVDLRKEAPSLDPDWLGRAVHHHIGAIDLVPFHPVDGSPATLEGAALLSRECAEALGALGQPTLLYGPAHASNRTLAALRKQTSFFRRGRRGADVEQELGESAGPDFGPAQPDPRTGVTVVGASRYVLNHNVVLSTEDFEVARAVARAVRGATPGGVPDVEAMAYRHYDLQGRRALEVACNLRAPLAPGSGPKELDKRVSEEARTRGASVLYSYDTNPLADELLYEWRRRQMRLVDAALRYPEADARDIAANFITWAQPPGQREALEL
eukprot:tig00001067_g6789.t1